MSSEFVPREEAHGLLKKLRERPENKICADCNAKNPTWASISHGIYLCFECAGTHRTLGTHISFVRSTTLDNWKRSELRMMEEGGNQRFRDWLSSHGAATLTGAERYKSRAAEMFREKLKEEATAQPVPAQSPLGVSEPPPKPADALAPADEKKPAATAPPPPPPPAPAPVADEPPRPTVMASKKVAPSTAPKGRLGAKKVDTDSFFADFDKPDDPPAAPTIADAQRQQQQAQRGGSGLYAYSDPGLLAAPAEPEATPFGMTKPKQPAAGGGGARVTPGSGQQQQQGSGRGGDSDYAQRKFAAAKAISSDQFFEEEKPKPAYDAEKEARLSRFTSARAISSADYFERDETGMGESSASDMALRFASTAGSDLSSLKEAVVDKTRQLASAAHQWLNEMQQS